MESQTPAGYGEDQILESLLLIEGNLEDDDVYYDFNRWPSCTCGHVYFVTEQPDDSIEAMLAEEDGDRGYEIRDAITKVRDTDGLYEAVMAKIAEANGLDEWYGVNPGQIDAKPDSTFYLSRLISCATRALYNRREGRGDFWWLPSTTNQVQREDSLALIRNTIRFIRDGQVTRMVEVATNATMGT